MSRLTKQITRWTDANLITAQQAAHILEFEQNRPRFGFGRGLTAVAIFAILLGILSVVASNWYLIPGSLKITIHLALNAGIAFLLFKKQSFDLWREGLTLGLFGLTLSFLVLVGQVFQLGDGTYSGLLSLWLVSTLPLMFFFARQKISVIPWMIAFLGTIFTVLAEHLDELSNPWQASFVTAIATLLPMALIADGHLSWVKTNRPVWSSIFIWTGFALMAFFTAISTFFLYEPAHWMESFLFLRHTLLVFAIGFAALGAHLFLSSSFSNDTAYRHGIWFIGLSLLTMMIPVFLIGYESGIFSALLFILYWVVVGLIAQKSGLPRVVSLSIGLIALRIFAIYVEVFGSLMSTGIGLIVGGAVLLGLLSLARRINRRMIAGGRHA